MERTGTKSAVQMRRATTKFVKSSKSTRNGEARPKSSQVKERVKSFFFRKSTKSGDGPDELDVDDKKNRRRIGSDRGASSGIMWNDSVEPVSESVKDTTRKIVRSFSREAEGNPMGTPVVLVEDTEMEKPTVSQADGEARDRRVAMAARLEAHSKAVDIEERETVTNDSELDVRDRRSRLGQSDSMPSQLSTDMHPFNKNGTPNNHRNTSEDREGLSPTGHLTVIGQEEGEGSKKGRRSVSFHEDVSTVESRATTERRDSLYMDYGDDEAFCIDGWHDDEDSLDDFSDEEPHGSDEEDEVDGPSAMVIGLPNEGTQKIRTVDEGKAIPKYQRVATEILTTESTYVKRLSILERMRQKLKESHALSEDACNSIFLNLPQLHTFHQDTLLPQLQQRIEKWDKYQRIGDVMKNTSPFLKMYTPFVKNIENARKQIISLKQKTAAKASTIITEFEKSEDSGRILMADFLTEPMTRLLRYKLLLGEYLRKLPEDHKDRKETELALDLISEVASHVNESIRAEDNMAKTLQIQESLRESLELVQPTRTFLKEGRIAMVDKTKSRHLERHIFLFNNLLLVCQPPVMGMKYRVEKQMSLKGLKVERDNENHFTVLSRRTVMEFYGSTQREADEWEKAFRDAIQKVKEAHKPRPDEAEIELDLEEELGYRAPRLVQRESYKNCNQCGLGFKSLRRPKNHCYACGQLFCPRCANRSLPLAYDNWNSRRVCDRCFSSLKSDAVCASVEDLSREDWIYGDLIPKS